MIHIHILSSNGDRTNPKGTPAAIALSIVQCIDVWGIILQIEVIKRQPNPSSSIPRMQKIPQRHTYTAATTNSAPVNTTERASLPLRQKSARVLAANTTNAGIW